MCFKIIKDEGYEQYLDEINRRGTIENLTGELEENVPFENFDFGDIDNEAWKTVGEEPQNKPSLVPNIPPETITRPIL